MVSLNLFDSLEDDAEDEEEEDDDEDEQTDEADADGDGSRWPVLAVVVAVVSSWILLELLLLEWLDSYY